MASTTRSSGANDISEAASVLDFLVESIRSQNVGESLKLTEPRRAGVRWSEAAL